jgi:TonB family protein
MRCRRVTLAFALAALPALSAFPRHQDIASLTQEKRTPPPDVAQVDREPVLKKKAEPRYPELAKKAGIEGKVWVKLRIDTDGKVIDAQLIKADHESLVEAALEAAKKFEFEPAIMKGKPVAVWVTVPFAFKLAEKSGESALGYNLTGTVTKILQGTHLDSCKQAVDPEAYLIHGSEYVHLLSALDAWGQKGGFPGAQGRSISFVHVRGSAGSDAYTLVLKTEVKKGAGTRFHTVVWNRSPGGEWKITQWHISE